MNEILLKQIGASGLEKYRDALAKIAKPTIELLESQSPITPSCSKFGGSPELPRSFEWPRHALGDYRFIGQINLAEIPKGICELGTTGLLSFFYAHDDEGEAFWGDPGYVRVIRFELSENFQTVVPPEPVRFGASSRIRFEAGADVPPWPWDEVELAKWPIDESDNEAYWDLRCELHPSHRYLLGYPFNTTLGYDPTPGPDWSSLLTLSSDDDLEWCWHDGDWLVTFIEKQRLRENDFSEIKSDAG